MVTGAMMRPIRSSRVATAYNGSVGAAAPLISGAPAESSASGVDAAAAAKRGQSPAMSHAVVMIEAARDIMSPRDGL